MFAVRDVDEAATAMDAIAGDYERHAAWVREIAAEYLDAQKVLAEMLRDLGIPGWRKPPKQRRGPTFS